MDGTSGDATSGEVVSSSSSSSSSTAAATTSGDADGSSTGTGETSSSSGDGESSGETTGDSLADPCSVVPQVGPDTHGLDVEACTILGGPWLHFNSYAMTVESDGSVLFVEDTGSATPNLVWRLRDTGMPGCVLEPELADEFTADFNDGGDIEVEGTTLFQTSSFFRGDWQTFGDNPLLCEDLAWLEQGNIDPKSFNAADNTALALLQTGPFKPQPEHALALFDLETCTATPIAGLEDAGMGIFFDGDYIVWESGHLSRWDTETGSRSWTTAESLSDTLPPFRCGSRVCARAGGFDPSLRIFDQQTGDILGDYPFEDVFEGLSYPYLIDDSPDHHTIVVGRGDRSEVPGCTDELQLMLWRVSGFDD